MSTSFTFRAKPDLSQAIRVTAAMHGLPVSKLIRRAIQFGLKNEDAAKPSPRPAEGQDHPDARA